MKEGERVRVNLKCCFFPLEKAQVPITTTYPKMLFVPQESIRRKIVHCTESCCTTSCINLTQNIFFTGRGILKDIPILKKIFTDWMEIGLLLWMTDRWMVLNTHLKNTEILLFIPLLCPHKHSGFCRSFCACVFLALLQWQWAIIRALCSWQPHSGPRIWLLSGKPGAQSCSQSHRTTGGEEARATLLVQ